MVTLMRIDERLLHGQVAATWLNYVQASSILIANDEVMENEMAKLAIKMAKPADIRLAIRTVEGAAELLKDPRTQPISIFVLVRTPEDAIRLVEKTDCIHHVNVGGIKKKDGSKMVATAVYVTQEDIENLKKLETMVDELEFRMVSSDTKKYVKDLFK